MQCPGPYCVRVLRAFGHLPIICEMVVLRVCVCVFSITLRSRILAYRFALRACVNRCSSSGYSFVVWFMGNAL